MDATSIEMKRFAQLRRIDSVCDDFERQLISGGLPAIEDFLDKVDDAEKETLFEELVSVELEFRWQIGEWPSVKDYEGRFATFSGVLRRLSFRPTSDQQEVLARLAATPTLLRGQRRIDRFELREFLGEGSFAVVWKAWDSLLRREVAVKVPRVQLPPSEGGARQMTEARAAGQLRHPNIVHIHELKVVGNVVLIISELVSGKSLEQHLLAGPLPARSAAELCVKLAGAIQHAHDNAVLHRDLKPANVLIDVNGEPRITDFGLARWNKDSAALSMDGIKGTPAYMSPEQARGITAEIDSRCDVYGLGTLLYELITGSEPFRGSQGEVLNAVLNDEPTRPSSKCRAVPRDLETICLKAMRKDKTQRYQTARDLQEDLRRFVDGRAILARRTGVFEQGVRFARRRPAAIAAAALLIVSIAAVSFGILQLKRGRELAGVRRVHLSTSPPLARMAIVPLDEIVGEPLADKVVYFDEDTSFQCDLSPGVYLVEVVFASGDFQQVLRTVPGKNGAMPGAYRHARWTVEADGSIALPMIESRAVAAEIHMTRIQADRAFEVGDVQSTTNPLRSIYVASFDLADTEFRLADYKRVTNGDSPKDKSAFHGSDDWAVRVNYDEAVAMAELAGGRLMTEAEFEYAATHGGESPFPWGNTAHSLTVASEFEGVSRPTFDQLTGTSVTGLCSNVFEWTSSYAAFDKLLAPTDIAARSAAYRVVKGGVFRLGLGIDKPTVSFNRNPRERTIVPGGVVNQQLGFRIVRSARPRFIEIRAPR